jgi:hypothetical protein
MAKSVLFGLKAALGVSGILLGLAAGSAMATTVTTSSVSLPNGNTTVNIDGSFGTTTDGGGSADITGTIGLQTNIGVLNTYCVDLFDYISLGSNTYNFSQSALTAGTSYKTGSSSTGTFTQAQVNTLTALLTNGTLQTQNTVNTAALQVAIWEVEYDTAAANGSYNLSTADSFYFTATSDSNSAATLAQAQTYLNDATGYQNGSTWVAATWLTNSTHFIELLTSNPAGTQNLIYLATPEPSTVALFGIGLIGLWAVRRRKLIS